MADHTVAAGDRYAYAKTLAANTADMVTFAGDAKTVRVTNDSGTAAIFFTVDGSAPAVNGPKSHRVPAAANASTEVDAPKRRATKTAVRLISSGTPTYSVEGSL